MVNKYKKGDKGVIVSGGTWKYEKYFNGKIAKIMKVKKNQGHYEILIEGEIKIRNATDSDLISLTGLLKDLYE